uniref:PDZ and LIM domain 7 n=1 Tax=Suricata suricatta TaxID=37032 RepID=A0A673TK47_SURSU
MDSFKVVLEGPAPWGFRLQGGKDFNVPLSISRLTPGGKAAQAGVAVGDWVLSIDGENAGGLTHIEAQNKIRACGERLSLGLSRAHAAQSKPQKALAPAADPPRYTFAPSASLNKTARPFGAPLPADSALQQNGQPLRPLVPDASKQRLMEDTEDWRPRPGTGQSRSFRILAHLTGTEFRKSMSWSCRAHATPASGTGTTSALPTCSTCSRSLALTGQLPSLPLSSVPPTEGTLPWLLQLLPTHSSPAPGLSLLLAWRRAWLCLTLPSLFALWYCYLPGLCWLRHGNKHSQPCFLCLCLLSLWACFGCEAVR